MLEADTSSEEKQSWELVRFRVQDCSLAAPPRALGLLFSRHHTPALPRGPAALETARIPPRARRARPLPPRARPTGGFWALPQVTRSLGAPPLARHRALRCASRASGCALAGGGPAGRFHQTPPERPGERRRTGPKDLATP